jgi:hypothetical protein
VTLQQPDQGVRKTWEAPKLTHLGDLDSHTGAAQVSADDGPSGSGTLGGASDTTS